MNQKKLDSMLKYLDHLNARLTSPTPEKHKDHPEAFKDYIRLEIKKATKTVDKLRLESTEGKK